MNLISPDIQPQISRPESRILSVLLKCGSLYFFGVAIAHAIQLKIPGLYIYYDLPSTAYQDLVISVLATGWALQLGVCSRNPFTSVPNIRALIISGVLAIVGLSLINLDVVSTDMRHANGHMVHWIETSFLAVYTAVLAGSLRQLTTLVSAMKQ